MRCFYCGTTGRSGSPEHIVPAHLGGRLTTRNVCDPCNQRAGKEIDEPLGEYLMVQIPRALHGVRHIRHQQREPTARTEGIDPAGEPVIVDYSAAGRQIFNAEGDELDDIDWVEIAYGLASDLWVRLAAKVTLGCASKIRDDSWLDERLARALQSVVWGGGIDTPTWPNGLPGWPDELEADSAIRQALGPDRHLVTLAAADDRPGSAVTQLFLFGGQITCQLPLPDFAVNRSGPAWVLDWKPGPPPPMEDFDRAVERLLRERGWSERQIDAARL